MLFRKQPPGGPPERRTADSAAPKPRSPKEAISLLQEALAPEKRRIGELLMAKGLITRAQLDDALRVQERRGGKLVEILVSQGHIDTPAFVRFLASLPGIASIDLSKYHVPKDLIALIPREFATRHEVFPIDRMGKLLTVGMVCPLDSGTLQELEKLTGLRVKPLLCAPEDIREAIVQYYPKEEQAPPAPEPAAAAGLPVPGMGRLATSVRLGSIATLIRQIEALPPLPDTVHRIRAALEDPESALRDVAAVIKQDPPIAAKVLSVANSAAYGLPNRVNDLDLAVSLLGLREAYAIVLSVSVSDMFNRSDSFDYHQFWSDCITCAAGAKLIAEAAGERRRRAAAFAAGLLAHVGQLALIEVAPERYAQISAELAGPKLLAAEQQAVGVAHPEAGFELVSNWGLPADICEAVRFHHDPGLATQEVKFVAIVALADRLARVDAGETAMLEALASVQDVVRMIGLDAGAVEAVVRDFSARRDALSGEQVL